VLIVFVGDRRRLFYTGINPVWHCIGIDYWTGITTENMPAAEVIHMPIVACDVA
jgi:hypothetical protein